MHNKMKEKINIGYNIPNIEKLVDKISKVIGLIVPVYVMPLKLKRLDENGYAVFQGGKYILFINPEILKKDKLTSFVIKLFIHELWHVKQMSEGRLSFNDNHTIATWEGKEYNSQIEHEFRPWEIEARRMESKYYKQVKI